MVMVISRFTMVRGIETRDRHENTTFVYTWALVVLTTFSGLFYFSFLSFLHYVFCNTLAKALAVSVFLSSSVVPLSNQ